MNAIRNIRAAQHALEYAMYGLAQGNGRLAAHPNLAGALENVYRAQKQLEKARLELGGKQR